MFIIAYSLYIAYKKVQNTVARIVKNASCFSHVTLTLRSL